jgi:ABC-2 type transport system permease protein
MTTLSTDQPAPLLLPALSLARRELVRFLRQRNRVIGALLTPIVFWLLIGGGIGRSFAAPGIPGGDSFLPFFFPGTIVMILLFTAIFSTISIIEDRREGFLQSVLVAPVPRLAIVLGKVLGGAALAFGQGLLFLLIAPLVGIPLTLASFAAACGVMLVLSVSLTALGFCLAWRMTSTQGFHAIMNLLLMPMWFLSGALFPASGSVRPIAWIMHANPLTYGLAALRRAMYLGQPAPALPSWPLSLGITLVFAMIMLFLATRLAHHHTRADLQ